VRQRKGGGAMRLASGAGGSTTVTIDLPVAAGD